MAAKHAYGLFGGPPRVDVVEHDHRVLPAQFERRPGEGAGRLGGDGETGGG
jgi:hypothetical protein